MVFCLNLIEEFKHCHVQLIIDYRHLFNDIRIDWKDVAKIKRRSSMIITFYVKNMLFIKLKDGRKYFFVCHGKKKEIIAMYKMYLQNQHK